jgi:hypothetical protein
VIVVVVVVVSRVIIVAASLMEILFFGISGKIFTLAQSHLTRKCLQRVDHEVTTSDEPLSRFSYHSSASKPNPQWL